MTTLARIEVERTAPARTLVVKRNAFADTWQRKPGGDVACGLRILPEDEITVAKTRAERIANRAHPGSSDESIRLWVEAYNGALMQWAIVNGTCDPNDVTQKWALIPSDADNLGEALTSDGIRFLFDAYEAFRIETDPTQAPLQDDEIPDLFDGLAGRLAALEHLDRARAVRARRLLAFVYAEVLSAE